MKRFATLVSLSWICACAVAADSPSADEAVRRLRAGLVPPVLVRGESPAMPTLEARMAELHVPAVSVAVIRGGRVEWARGFGSRSAAGGVVDADTLFQAASISKPVFALAVLHLADAGTLDLDADVDRYLRRWKLPRNEFTAQAPVTLRRLLSHSAGTTVHGFPGYAANAPLPTLVQLLDGVAPANTFAVRVDVLPGSTYRYSGGGYEVAQALVEDATQTPLPKLMQEAVLIPLGMTSSTFEQPLPARLWQRVAQPHRRDGGLIDGGPHVYPELAAAGLWTTPTDLARYAIGIQQAFAGNSTVLSEAGARQMLTPVLANHGLGPIVGGAQRKYFTHNGGNEGYRCLLVAYTDGDGAVVMTNGDRGGELMEEVMRTIASLYGWPDFAPPLRTKVSLDRDSRERVVGAYQLENGPILLVRARARGLVAHLVGSPPRELFASGPRDYFAVQTDFELAFPGDRIDAVRYREKSRDLTGVRLDASRAARLLASAASVDKRVAAQRPERDSREVALRLLDGLARGSPDYGRMSPALAELTRQQLTWLQPWIGGIGALQSLTFHSVDPGGGDRWDAKFDREVVRLEIRLDDTGRLDALSFPPRD